jgi:peptidyl-dipeptidase Dcp
VDNILAELVPAAVAKARREAADMQTIIDREHGGFKVASWDWDFYAEKVRKARYDFDESQLKPYFELNHVLQDGVFFAAHRLYGLTFKERHDLPVYQADVRVFEVYDSDGQPLALLLEDFYARPSKLGGAWMNEYVSQNSLFGDKPVVGNHHNIPKPADGEPTLLTFDEVVTLFHEFGHGLHGMFSHVRYPLFAGTSVPRDFVEYPSQVNEMWAAWPEVVKNYAKHYKTGEPMPTALLDKMLATQKFNMGFETLEYLKATLLDQGWHTLRADQVPSDVGAFETAVFKKYGADFDPVPPRYRSPYFQHAFAGGYSAGYYSYIWSDVLVADSIEWFKNHGGLKRESGDHFRATVLSNGGSVEAMTLFHEFTGSDPDIGPLIRHRGLDE